VFLKVGVDRLIDNNLFDTDSNQTKMRCLDIFNSLFLAILRASNVLHH